MPTWGEIFKQLTERKSQVAPQYHGQVMDEIRRHYLAACAAHSHRNTILYATSWLQKPTQNQNFISINDEDMQGFMEAVHGANGPDLDLILHSPGGSAESAEAIVNYLRSKFQNIRVIVPHAAMSAACMLACAADEIIMGCQSSLGPTDPQMIVRTANGAQQIPAQAIKDQFELAKKECATPGVVNAWIPMLKDYGPALLVQCDNAQQLSEQLVSSWLATYMFRGEVNPQQKATDCAAKLAAHTDHKSHARHLGRDTARSYGLTVTDLEADDAFQDLVLSVYHMVTFAFSQSGAVKIIENDRGNAFLKMEMPQVGIPMQMKLPVGFPPVIFPGGIQPGGTPPGMGGFPQGGPPFGWPAPGNPPQGGAPPGN